MVLEIKQLQSEGENMNLVELAKEKGLYPRRTAATHGGEYHCACPECGGKDRFVIWPNQKQNKCVGRYWCRQCSVHGDAIEFCRKIMGLSWDDALKKLDLPSIQFEKQHLLARSTRPKLAVANEPPQLWKERANGFVQRSHDALLRTPEIMECFYERGFNDEAIRKFQLGYSCSPPSSAMKDSLYEYADWGLAPETKENGSIKPLWIPHGLVAPAYSEKKEVVKINIRRLSWFEGDKMGKYIKVKGSMKAPAVYGDASKRVAVILESELDAMLIQQFAAELCFCVATGGSTQPIDLYTDHLLRKTLVILICPDVDSAGAQFCYRLLGEYKQAKLWPAPLGKSPGDALKDHGIDLLEWIVQGLPIALQPQQEVVNYEFTCKNCGKHDYWVSIFDDYCCAACVPSAVDESLMKYPAQIAQKPL